MQKKELEKLRERRRKEIEKRKFYKKIRNLTLILYFGSIGIYFGAGLLLLTLFPNDIHIEKVLKSIFNYLPYYVPIGGIIVCVTIYMAESKGGKKRFIYMTIFLSILAYIKHYVFNR